MPLPPRHVEVDREQAVTVEWEDGHVSRFGLEELRRSCHCAECRSLRERGEVIWPRGGAPEVLRVETAQLVGAYGLNVVWNDSHETGIYSWEMLRALCPCPVCTAGP